MVDFTPRGVGVAWRGHDHAKFRVFTTSHVRLGVVTRVVPGPGPGTRRKSPGRVFAVFLDLEKTPGPGGPGKIFSGFFPGFSEVFRNFF